MTCIVKLSNISRSFRVDSGRLTMFNIIRSRMNERENMALDSTFNALDKINVAVMKGEKIGIIGNNGSGKTTLLRIIAGLLPPTGGQLKVHGTAVLLAGFGVGMIDELSVRENIYLYGAIYGIDREKIQHILLEIIEWAELQEFSRAKLRTLSSGMKSRLAFSIIRHIETDIFLLDEALTAGDRTFKKKCRNFFDAPINEERTFLISTHDLDFVQSYCQKTLWLKHGKQMAFGKTESVVEQYIHH